MAALVMTAALALGSAQDPKTPAPADRPGPKSVEKPLPEPPPEAPEWFGGRPWWTWDRATGDWACARRWLESRGVGLVGYLLVDSSRPFSGGVRKRTTVRQLWGIGAALDGESLLGVDGLSAYAEYYSHAGRNGSKDTGDLQSYSNIDGPHVHALAKAWVQQWLFNRTVRVKVGKVESNNEFAYAEAAAEFLNASAGHSPTIVAMPTYPNPAMSVNVFLYPARDVYVGGAVYDGALNDGVSTGSHGIRSFFSDRRSDEYFWYAEVGVLWELPGGLEGRAALGGWHHTGDFGEFDGGLEEGTEGVYLVTEQRLWREPASQPLDPRGIAAFLQYGWADEEHSSFSAHVGLGAAWTGPLAARPTDVAGLMLSWTDLSDASGSPHRNDETAVEAFYRLRLTAFISLKFNLQFIDEPSGDPAIDDAWVFTLRFNLRF